MPQRSVMLETIEILERIDDQSTIYGAIVGIEDALVDCKQQPCETEKELFRQAQQLRLLQAVYALLQKPETRGA
jgi:hypothetical protein